MARLLGDPQVMRHYPQPKTYEEALAWITWNQRLYREHGFGLWLLTLRATGEFVCDCGLTPSRSTAGPNSRSATTSGRRSRVAVWPPKPRPPAATTPATSWGPTG
jgi:RimJ/RimL family protein N-acetyltransferase